MLLLLFYIGNDRYVCSGDEIIEIIPRVHLKNIPHTPDYVKGLLNFGGHPIPVIDLRQLIEDKPCQNSMHTRIILFACRDSSNEEHRIGVIAERVTETVEYDLEQFVDPGLQVKDLPFFGKVLSDEHGMVRLILVDELFASIEEHLFSNSAEAFKDE